MVGGGIRKVSARHIAATAVYPRALRLVFVFSLGAACCACAPTVMRGYAGPQLQPAEVATLSGSKHILFLLFYSRGTLILPDAVDDYVRERGTDEWELLPGPHVVRATYYLNHVFAGGGAVVRYSPQPVWRLVSFTAEPGRRYRVDGHIIEPMPDVEQFCAWIEDDETGELVGGSKDCSVPEPILPSGETARSGARSAGPTHVSCASRVFLRQTLTP